MTTEVLPQGYIRKENNLLNIQLLEGNVNEESKNPKEWMDEAYKAPEKTQRYKVDNYITANKCP